MTVPKDQKVNGAIKQANEESSKLRAKFRGAEFDKPVVRIKSISIRGEMRLCFSNTMYVPFDYTSIGGDF